jgi:DNA-binding IclR family transcriptional regulator
MDYIALNDNAGRKDLQAELGLSQSKAVRLLRALTEKEMIAANGRGKNTRYTAKDK